MLKRILATKRREVAEAKKRTPMQAMKEQLAKAPPTRDFRRAVKRTSAYEINLIAELKKASPVKGVLRSRFDPAALASEFEKAGASALSVLTDLKYFQGIMENITYAKASCGLPVLRKDFIVDEYQLYQSRLAGADAVLLIAMLLPQRKLKEFVRVASHLSLAPVVEVHTSAGLKRALDAGAEMIGINTRDLTRFKTDFEVAAELRPRIPPDRIVICESGIDSPRQIEKLRELKFDAVLIGESLMRSRTPHAFIHELFYS